MFASEMSPALAKHEATARDDAASSSSEFTAAAAAEPEDAAARELSAQDASGLQTNDSIELSRRAVPVRPSLLHCSKDKQPELLRPMAPGYGTAKPLVVYEIAGGGARPRCVQYMPRRVHRRRSEQQHAVRVRLTQPVGGVAPRSRPMYCNPCAPELYTGSQSWTAYQSLTDLVRSAGTCTTCSASCSGRSAVTSGTHFHPAASVLTLYLLCFACGQSWTPAVIRTTSF